LGDWCGPGGLRPGRDRGTKANEDGGRQSEEGPRRLSRGSIPHGLLPLGRHLPPAACGWRARTATTTTVIHHRQDSGPDLMKCPVSAAYTVFPGWRRRFVTRVSGIDAKQGEKLVEEERRRDRTSRIFLTRQGGAGPCSIAVPCCWPVSPRSSARPPSSPPT